MAFLQNIQLTLLPEQAGESSLLKEEVAKKIHVRREEVTDVRIIRKSIDARSRSQVKINLCVDVYTKGTKPQPIAYPFQYQDVSKGEPVLVIGAGPAGIFSALELVKLKKEGKNVLLCAGDTFRAAAIDQLDVWAQRAGVETVKHKEGADPAAVMKNVARACKKATSDGEIFGV